jgi:hypothetical protein
MQVQVFPIENERPSPKQELAVLQMTGCSKKDKNMTIKDEYLLRESRCEGVKECSEISGPDSHV